MRLTLYIMLTNNGMIKEGKDCFGCQKGSQECDVAKGQYGRTL